MMYYLNLVLDFYIHFTTHFTYTDGIVYGVIHLICASLIAGIFWGYERPGGEDVPSTALGVGIAIIWPIILPLAILFGVVAALGWLIHFPFKIRIGVKK